MAAQQTPKRDSLYDKIEVYAKKRKVSSLLYNMVFRRAPDADTIQLSKAAVKRDYSDKFIRKIIISTADPLGYSTSPAANKEPKKYETLGNRLHMKTRNSTVRGYLLFREGQKFSAQKLYESERILRATSFIHRVRIEPVESSATKDSVDVAVYVVDTWSLRPLITVGGQQIGAGLSEGNFLGMGHELSFQYRYDMREKHNTKVASYIAKNLYGTYIDASVMAMKDFDGNENVYIHADRQFVSPLTRWAGGVAGEHILHNIRIPQPGKELNDFPEAMVKIHNQKVWGGYQFRLPNKNSDEVTSNIGITASYENRLYQERPTELQDPADYYHSAGTFLASVAYTERKFDVRRNIFRYNLPEDIPYGKAFALTGGFRNDHDGSVYPYFGASAGYGTFTKIGYFNYKAQYGTFIKDGMEYRSALQFDGTYWTRLHDWNFAYARHFVSHTYVRGNNRSDSYSDRINLTSQNEFPVYNEYFVGKDKLMLRYQLQLNIKKPWKNFNINPYAMVGLGWLGVDDRPLFSAPVNTKFALGATFFNPYLAFTRFQISLVYYPKVPFENGGSFGFNGYTNDQLPINTFRVERPSVVCYGN